MIRKTKKKEYNNKHYTRKMAKKKTCLKTGQIVGIVVAVLAWLTVSILYTLGHVKVWTFSPLYNSVKKSVSQGESRIYIVPESYGYVSVQHSIYKSSLVQVFKDLENVTDPNPFVIDYGSGHLSLDPSGYACSTMFLLPGSTIHINTSSKQAVCAQVMTTSNYERLKSKEHYTVLMDWVSDGEYITGPTPMDHVFCVKNSVGVEPAEVNYTGYVLSAKYDSKKAVRTCSSPKCVFHSLSSNEYVVIFNSDSRDTLYDVKVGYNALYRYYLTVIIWLIPVYVAIFVGIFMLISKCCCKNNAADITREIYNPIVNNVSPDGSFDYSRKCLNGSAGRSDSSYLLYCSDEDI